jgi:hypothetical protein
VEVTAELAQADVTVILQLGWTLAGFDEGDALAGLKLVEAGLCDDVEGGLDGVGPSPVETRDAHPEGVPAGIAR